MLVGEIHAEYCPWFVELLSVRMDGRLFLNEPKFTIKPTDNPSAQHKLCNIQNYRFKLLIVFKIEIHFTTRVLIY